MKYNNNTFNLSNEKKTVDLLKNIKYTFDILNNIIKYLINITNNDSENINEKTQKDIDNIILPVNVDKLVLLIAYFPNSFNEDVTKLLYNIINLDCYKDLYAIYQINDLLMPFIDNGEISIEMLNKDFNIIYENLCELVCELFNLNTDFECLTYI